MYRYIRYIIPMYRYIQYILRMANTGFVLYDPSKNAARLRNLTRGSSVSGDSIHVLHAPQLCFAVKI
jgi:hypothetical protein